MKKVAFAIALLVAIHLISSLWSSKAINSSQDITQTPAGTSLANGLSIDEMIDQSDLIAIGSCVDARSVWVDRALVTLATVSVAETLKGAPSGTITVALPGGIDANRKFPVAMNYPGAPRMTPGEDVFLFLTAGESAGSYTVTGYSQGKFSIARDDAGERIVTRDLTRRTLKENNGVRRGATDATPLPTLKAQVKAHLRQR